MKRVNELDFYNLGRDQLAEKVGLSRPKTSAVIWCLKLQEDAECFKQLTIGKSKFNRYSQKAIDHIKEALKEKSIDDIWREYRPKSRRKKKG